MNQFPCLIRSSTPGGEARYAHGVERFRVAHVLPAAHAAYQQTLHRDTQPGLDDIDTVARLRRLQRELTPNGKQGFLRRVTAIALLDGALTNIEKHANQPDAMV